MEVAFWLMSQGSLSKIYWKKESSNDLHLILAHARDGANIYGKDEDGTMALYYQVRKEGLLVLSQDALIYLQACLLQHPEILGDSNYKSFKPIKMSNIFVRLEDFWKTT